MALAAPQPTGSATMSLRPYQVDAVAEISRTVAAGPARA
jgi:hypothetical protein